MAVKNDKILIEVLQGNTKSNESVANALMRVVDITGMTKQSIEKLNNNNEKINDTFHSSLQLLTDNIRTTLEIKDEQIQDHRIFMQNQTKQLYSKNKKITSREKIIMILTLMIIVLLGGAKLLTMFGIL
jgi:hypothetical protein